MIFGEHEVKSGVEVYGTNGNPGMLMSALMGIRVGDSRRDLTRAEVERLRDLCDEALS